MVEVFDLHQAEHKTIHLTRSTRGGAVVARRAHNPKVRGSNPFPATKQLGSETNKIGPHNREDLFASGRGPAAAVVGIVEPGWVTDVPVRSVRSERLPTASTV